MNPLGSQRHFQWLTRTMLLFCFIFHFPREKKNCLITRPVTMKERRKEKALMSPAGLAFEGKKRQYCHLLFRPQTQNSSFHPNVSLSLSPLLFNTTFVFVPLDKNIKRVSFIPPSEMPPGCKRGRGGRGGFGGGLGFVGFFSHVANSKTTEYVMKSHPSTCQNPVI